MDTALQIEWVAAERLFPNPANPRRNDAAVPHVVASIRRFGWQQPIVAKPSGEIIAGHTRLKAALDLGHETVPVVWFEGTDLDAAAFLIADNRSHTFSEWDEPVLAKLLEELRREDALEGVGFDDQDIDRLLAELEDGLADGSELEDPGPEPEPEHPVSQRGDLWILGGHRILCGDSTNAEDMAALMDGETAALLATDPPYLVDYQGGNHPQSWSNRPEVRDKHWDDYVDPKTGLAFFTDWLRVALAHCRVDVPIYQWHATRRQMLVEQAWVANGLLVHQTIIWAKARPVLTRCHFMWAHEPCFYGWKEGNMPRPPRAPDRPVGAVVGDELHRRAAGHPLRKLQDVSDRGAAEAVEALVLVADHAEVSRRLRELQQQTFLDVVGVLVLVDEHVLDRPCDRLDGGRVVEQTEDGTLQVGEVDPVGLRERLLVGDIGPADGREEGIRGRRELSGIDEFLGDFVEVGARAIDGRPAGLPAAQEEIVFRRADDLPEVLEEEQELRQLVERVVVVAQGRAVAVLRQHPVAQAVNGRHHQLRQITRVEGRCGLDDLERRRCDRPDSIDRLQVLDGRIQDATQVPESGDQRLRRLLHVGSRDRERQEQLHHFVVGEAVEP